MVSEVVMSTILCPVHANNAERSPASAGGRLGPNLIPIGPRREGARLDRLMGVVFKIRGFG